MRFEDVSDDALAFLNDPNPGWANPTDCVEWPCTAPENVVMIFDGTSFSGVRPSISSNTFQLVSDVFEAGEAYS